MTEGMATRADIAALKADVAAMEVRVTVRLYGALIAVVVANVGLTVTLLKLL